MRAILYIILGIICLAAIVFLSKLGESQTVGQSIQWTATGDDGNVGRASQYDVRYSTNPISGVDTLSWWNAATQALNEPVPSVAGVTDSMRILGLQASTTYRFLLRAADEVPNWSGYSNVATITTVDLVPPARVTDLRTGP